jgi:polyhydroxyalkanoate synthase subunit PhaC
MTHRDEVWQVAEDAAEAVGPEAGLFASADMASFGESMLAVLTRAVAHPVEIGEAGLRFWATMARIGQSTVARSVGSDAPPPIQAGRDKRFTDPAWEENPGFFALRQAYLAVRKFADDVLVAGHGDPVSDRKAEMALGLLLDASSPTNFLLTNPAALKRAFETGGGSVLWARILPRPRERSSSAMS